MHHTFPGLRKETIGRSIYQEKIKEKCPGLALETNNICRELVNEDCNITGMGKYKYRESITLACHGKK